MSGRHPTLYPQTYAPPRPSPLAKVAHTRPISQDPAMGLVRDPMFWKRFSKAVHLTEELRKDEEESGLKKVISSVKGQEGDAWLLKQRKKKRRCRIIGLLITIAILMVAAATIVVYLMLKKLDFEDSR